jgi:hypothetical protein
MKKPSNYTEQEWEEYLAERAFEEVAAFGESVKMVNISTGERWVSGQYR